MGDHPTFACWRAIEKGTFMKLNRTALLGSILAMILSGTTLQAQTPQDRDAADMVRDLIERGYLAIDPSSGRILMKRSVYEILKDSQVIQQGLIQKAGLNDIPKSSGKCEGI